MTHVQQSSFSKTNRKDNLVPVSVCQGPQLSSIRTRTMTSFTMSGAKWLKMWASVMRTVGSPLSLHTAQSLSTSRSSCSIDTDTQSLHKLCPTWGTEKNMRTDWKTTLINKQGLNYTQSFSTTYTQTSSPTRSYLSINGGGQDVLDVAQQLVSFHQVCGWGVLEGQVALHRVCEPHSG